MSSAAMAADTVDRAIDTARAAMIRDPAGGLKLAVEANRLAVALPKGSTRQLAIATAHVVEADALNRLDRYDEAWRLVSPAIAVLGKLAPGSKTEGDALIISGAINAIRGNLAAALHDYQSAFRDYQRVGANRGEAIALLWIGSLYGDAIDYASSLKYVNQAAALYHDEPSFQLAIYNNKASALQEIGRYADAETGYRHALSLAHQMKAPLLEARLLGNIARARLKLNDVAGAETALDQASAIARQGEAASWQPQLVAIAAQAAYQRRDYATATRLIGQRFAGVDLAATTIQFREAHQTAYDTYRATGDTRLALAHLAALKRLDDQATRLATSANAALASARFDFANQELKLETLRADDANRKAELERQRADTERLVFLLVGGAIVIVTALLAVGVVTLRRSRDRVRAAAADLAVTNQALGKALAAKTEFLATTSHEIRTPLNGILGMTQVMLADSRLPAATRERIGVVHGAGVTMRALVDDILDVAKMETGHLSVEAAPFDLHATLTDAARLWREQAEAKGLAFALNLAGCPATVLGDAARVRQVAFNLLSNALKFTAAGRVALSVTAAGDRYRIAVSDTGIGIPADQHEAIFESFRQADAGTTRQFGGTGLGLAICRNLVAAMGGEVTIASVPGEGSTFTVALPLRAPAGVATTAAAAVMPDGAAAATMIVDANPISRAMLSTLVGKRDAGAVAVASLADAMQRAVPARVVIDQGALATLDDPAAALASLRARGGAVIVLWKGEVPDAVAAAADRVVAKPIGGSALLDAVFGTLPQLADATTLVPRAA